MKLKLSNRAIMTFEYITNKSFNITTLTDQYILYYSILSANNKDSFKYTFDEFIDHLDEHPEDLQFLNSWMAKEMEIKNQFNDSEVKKKKGKK
jgi:hypothetical protein